MFLMPTLLSDTNLFLWVDLESPTPEETKYRAGGCLPLPSAVHRGLRHGQPVAQGGGVFAEGGGPVYPLPVHGDPRGGLQPQGRRVRHQRAELLPREELPGHLPRRAAPQRHRYRGTCAQEPPCTSPAPRTAWRTRCWIRSSRTTSRRWRSCRWRLPNWSSRRCSIRLPQTLNKILQIKKEVLHLRQIIGPQREVLARFARGEFKLIRAHLVPYYRDVYDALFHISELAQSYTDSLTGILQVYLNMSSNQTGEVVKLLTMITVITTPLMMVGTWYGMNFNHMPETETGATATSAAAAADAVLHGRHLLVFQEEEVVLDFGAAPGLTAWPANPVSSTRCSAASGGSTPKVCRRSCSAWRASAAFLETLFNTIEDGVLVVDEAGPHSLLQPGGHAPARAAAQRGGPADHRFLAGPGLAEDRARFDAGRRHRAWCGTSSRCTIRARASCGSTPRRWTARRAAARGVALILHDATEARQKTFEAIESERIQALTLLAASVAHEIGNPLNALHIHLQLMEREVRKLKAVARGADRIPARVPGGAAAVAAPAPADRRSLEIAARLRTVPGRGQGRDQPAGLHHHPVPAGHPARRRRSSSPLRSTTWCTRRWNCCSRNWTTAG